jgi:hypothetical protein
MRRRLAGDRWLPVLALVAWLLAPAGSARAQEAGAAKPDAAQPEAKAPEQAAAGRSAADAPLSEEEEEKLDAEDDKKREKAEDEQKRWRAKSKKEVAEDELAQARTMGRRTTRFLSKASELLQERQYDESNKVLSRLNPKRLNSYERAMVYKYQAYNAYGKATQAQEADKTATTDIRPAIELLRKAIDEKVGEQPILPKQDVQDMLYQISQMQMGVDDYEGAIATLKTWFAQEEKPGGIAYFTLAVAYYQLKDLDAALVPAKKAIEVAENPQQGWLQLVLAIHLNKEDYASATPVLVELLTRYPDVGKAYWLQLATLYGVQKDIPRALAVMQLAHRRGMLDEDPNVRRLASLLQSEEIPIRSVRILEQGFEKKILKEEAATYEMLGNSWILARESDKAEPSLQKAAELSPEGDLFVRLGQVRLLKEDYDGAASALKSGLAKGGIDDPGQAEQLLGITYYNAGKLSEAKTWFAKSRRSEKARPMSEAWMKHIDEELQKKGVIPGDGETAAGISETAAAGSVGL